MDDPRSLIDEIRSVRKTEEEKARLISESLYSGDDIVATKHFLDKLNGDVNKAIELIKLVAKRG